ncbi:MAG TPA: LysR family transcriptional regulator [Phycisphaerales bacterium]|nr:LysR family transcriptional regulator [Phycisphaerales bacterium]
MSAIAARIQELGLQLPAPAAPAGSYVPVAQTGSLLIVSGQLPFCDGSLLAEGPVPSTCSLEKAVEGAKQCGLNALSALQHHLGDLDRVSRVVRVGVFVASDPEFTAQPTVANGVSDLFFSVFGEAGRHARAAVGCPSLPLGTAVEVEVMVEISGD